MQGYVKLTAVNIFITTVFTEIQKWSICISIVQFGSKLYFEQLCVGYNGKKQVSNAENAYGTRNIKKQS